MGTEWNAYDAQKMSAGKAYGEALAEIAKDNPNIVALTADLAKSTNTGIFGNKYPDRMFNVGIAEQNLFGMAAGMAKVGYIPFASTFASFASMRACEQIRTDICYQNLNVKIIATHGGLSFGTAGSTHHCIEDIAIMRSLPRMTVCIPADAYETSRAIKECVNINGPFYLRVGRGMEPLLHTEENNFDFKIGKAMKLKEGHDVCIIACGIPVRDSLIAANNLEKQGISVEVINMHTIKPLDEEAVLEVLNKTKKIITVEEGNIIGGLGDAVASVLATSGKRHILTKMGINDEFSPIGKPEDLYAIYKLTSQGIEEKVLEILGKEIEEEDWEDED